MNSKSKEVINSIYNKKTEVHYNEWFIYPDNKPIKLELQGKIKCPLLNTGISSLVCSKLMDKNGWPRSIDDEICDKCSCYIHKSIRKFKKKE